MVKETHLKMPGRAIWALGSLFTVQAHLALPDILKVSILRFFHQELALLYISHFCYKKLCCPLKKYQNLLLGPFQMNIYLINDKFMPICD